MMLNIFHLLQDEDNLNIKPKEHLLIQDSGDLWKEGCKETQQIMETRNMSHNSHKDHHNSSLKTRVKSIFCCY